MTTNDVRNADMNENAVPSDAELRDVLDVFKTMSDPTRMRIILAIAGANYGHRSGRHARPRSVSGFPPTSPAQTSAVGCGGSLRQTDLLSFGG